MFNTQFYILFNIKTANGMESYGKFFVGNNHDTAHSIFKSLKGSREVNDENMLYIELVEISKGLPVNLKMISCTLNELGTNCKYITKEVFKAFNLSNNGA
jgi:hypothetical protein